MKKLNLKIIIPIVVVIIATIGIVIFINNKSIKLNKDDMENIIRIIRNWTHEYTNNKIIGESHDYINIYEDNKKYSYVFHNNYPTDMDNLISYIGDMYAR